MFLGTPNRKPFRAGRAITAPGYIKYQNLESVIRGKTRIQSIDLLRGIVMILMPLDHVRDFFSRSAFLFDPTDLAQTTPILFFTRWITHFCAPVFVFLAGTSAYLSGVRKGRNELSSFLLTRGAWLVFAEIVIVTFSASFNPTYPFIKLQVIWATGLSMIALAFISRLNRNWILAIGLILVAGHNLLDEVHVQGSGAGAFLWAVLHEHQYFQYGHTTVMVLYPVIPWIGILTLGYWFGRFFVVDFDSDRRKLILNSIGISAILLFIILRAGNFYGDHSSWSTQKNLLFGFMSFINVTKYPPSLLYALVTIGPALIFHAYAEKNLNFKLAPVKVFGRVPMFYYLIHFYIIHLLAMIGAVILGYSWNVMILSKRINETPELKGYGFNLLTVYIIWMALIYFLYPFCKWFDGYKRDHLKSKPWLSYF